MFHEQRSHITEKNSVATFVMFSDLANKRKLFVQEFMLDDRLVKFVSKEFPDFFECLYDVPKYKFVLLIRHFT